MSSSSAVIHLDLTRLPVAQKKALCTVLDQNDCWLELGKLMKFDDLSLIDVTTEASRNNRSPSEVLIGKWSHYAHNVTELFKLLADMQHFQAMEIIKTSVDKRYHIWLKPMHPHFTQLLASEKKANAQSQIFAHEQQNEQRTPAQDEDQKNMKDLLNIPKISLDELAAATNNWSDKNILGKGGFGVVYKGNWLCTMVAIKKLEYRESRSGSYKDHLLQSLNEMRVLNNCRHDNILAIYGYAIESSTCQFIVYQLMSGGSLEERLLLKTRQEALSWPQRWTIAKGTARGLQFLHRYKEKPLIHGDIKPANILLDTCCEPKIADFGLSREGHEDDEFEEISKAFGTKPYLPQEFIFKKLFSTKVDVFSYGVVLFEIATGYKSHEFYENADSKKKLVYLYERMARVNESSIEAIRQHIDKAPDCDEACLNLCQLLIYLGKKCTDHNPNYRPDMLTILQALENFVPCITAENNSNQNGK